MPHIDMSVAMLREHGVTVDVDSDDPTDATWTVAPGPLRALDRVVEPDLSNAAPFLAAALVTGGPSPCRRGRSAPPRPATRCACSPSGWAPRSTWSPEGLTVSGGDTLLGLDADLHDVGELTPVLAAICALASTPSHLRGIAHLRGHETDRLAALAHEINALGGDVQETKDWLVIRPRALHGGVVETYDDHRMATAGAVLGLAVPGVEVVDVATTAKTLPDFVTMWQSMLGGRAA